MSLTHYTNTELQNSELLLYFLRHNNKRRANTYTVIGQTLKISFSYSEDFENAKFIKISISKIFLLKNTFSICIFLKESKKKLPRLTEIIHKSSSRNNIISVPICLYLSMCVDIYFKIICKDIYTLHLM